MQITMLIKWMHMRMISGDGRMGGWMEIDGCTGKSCVATGSQHADFASAVSQAA